jgi:glycosyltransferase involved in cell wall biosynthesis
MVLNPQVSVLLPCYNAAAALPEALDSLLAQTLADFEIVAVDDGSTDDTLRILEAYARLDRRLRIFAQPHQGILAALNAGLAACRAPLTARMDADDRCHPARLQRQWETLQAQPELTLAACRAAAFPPGQVREGLLVYLEWQNALCSNAAIQREIFVESPFVHSSVMYRTRAVIELGGYQEHGWAEDYDLWLRLHLAGARFAKLEEALLEWRESPQRLTRSDSRYSLENFLRAKAHYLGRGPLAGREAVFIWGAGMMGRRLSKHLLREGAPLAAFIDIDPRKIGGVRRGYPILPPETLGEWWGRYHAPVLLVAVGARGARPLIRARLQALGLVEGQDWWLAA